MDLAIDSDNFIYVADHLNHRIQKFNSAGKFLDKWGTYGAEEGQFNRPHGIAIGNDEELFVCDSQNFRIQKFTLEGIFKSQ
jgi:DNA-binding beta-propeller fold protein YncE